MTMTILATAGFIWLLAVLFMFDKTRQRAVEESDRASYERYLHDSSMSEDEIAAALNEWDAA